MSSFITSYRNLLARDELQSDSDQLLAVQSLDHLARLLERKRRWRFFLWWRGQEKIKSIYLWGGVGRGKTMLMDLFFEDLALKKKRRVHFLEFMQETHQALKKLREHQEGDPIISLSEQLAERYDLLCLDEFQVSDIADASILGRLFASLLSEGLILVATSNRKPDDLYLGGLNRDRFLPFIDFIKREAEVIGLGMGKDYRREAMIGTERYYINNSQALSQSFTRLTHGRATACKLDVGQRYLTIRKQAMGCAYFHFDDLCVQPLSGSDYLALAHAFHTVLIDEIPVLTRAKRNEARRFIHLIDALYDNRVLLIANAQARPDELYRKTGLEQQDDGFFEFERTTSRLTEMQSSDYMPIKAI